jgi:RND family efflux transporter MFP subunit
MNTTSFSKAVAALTALFGLTLAGCQSESPSLAQTPRLTVTVAAPLEREIFDYTEFTGRTEAINEVQVQARVSGYLTRVRFQEGTEVEKDQPLFEIDKRPYQAELDRAQAQLKADQARLEIATITFNRYQNLLARNAASREDFDRSLAERNEAAAAIDADKAAIARAQLDVDFCDIKAPVAGRTGRALITEGNLITIPVGGSSTLTTIIPQDPMYVYFDVPERNVIRYLERARERSVSPSSIKQANIAVEMGLAEGEAYPFRGTLDFVDNTVDPSTGTMKVRAVFLNPDRRLTAGLFARVRIPEPETHRALLLPERALGTDQGLKFVWIVNPQGTVERREVTLGTRRGGLREVVSGLQPDDRVVITGIQRVREGAEVEVRLVTFDEETGAEVTAEAAGPARPPLDEGPGAMVAGVAGGTPAVRLPGPPSTKD